jgi:hypothetical protein
VAAVPIASPTKLKKSYKNLIEILIRFFSGGSEVNHERPESGEWIGLLPSSFQQDFLQLVILK